MPPAMFEVNTIFYLFISISIQVIPMFFWSLGTSGGILLYFLESLFVIFFTYNMHPIFSMPA
jgi:hypothetical protein